MIQIYVDGSYNKETNKTGAGIVIIEGQEILKKSILVKTEADHSWNIDGECHAVLEALSIVSGKSIIQGKTINYKDVMINYDYLGIEKWPKKEWATKSKIARHYVSEFNKIVEENNLNVQFNKVKAHSGNEYNDIADELAKEITIK